jgi:hypothetical protein
VTLAAADRLLRSPRHDLDDRIAAALLAILAAATTTAQRGAIDQYSLLLAEALLDTYTPARPAGGDP